MENKKISNHEKIDTLDLVSICDKVVDIIYKVGFKMVKMKNESGSEKEELTYKYVELIENKSRERLTKYLLKIEPRAIVFSDKLTLTDRAIIDKLHNQLAWVIEPIDGTTNFINGLHNYAISIALVKIDDGLITDKIGVVYEPETKRCYYAIKGHGAFVEHFYKANSNHKLKVSNNSKIRESIIGFGLPHDKRKIKSALKSVHSVLDKVSDIKITGPTSIDICRVAEGKLDGYFEDDLKVWKLRAASLILKEAGGEIIGIGSNGLKFDVASVMATNTIISGELEELIMCRDLYVDLTEVEIEFLKKNKYVYLVTQSDKLEKPEIGDVSYVREDWRFVDSDRKDYRDCIEYRSSKIGSTADSEWRSKESMTLLESRLYLKVELSVYMSVSEVQSLYKCAVAKSIDNLNGRIKCVLKRKKDRDKIEGAWVIRYKLINKEECLKLLKDN